MFGHIVGAPSLAFLQSGKLIVSGSDDYPIRIWGEQDASEKLCHEPAFTPFAPYKNWLPLVNHNHRTTLLITFDMDPEFMRQLKRHWTGSWTVHLYVWYYMSFG
jgi:WD40 repeat protein